MRNSGLAALPSGQFRRVRWGAVALEVAGAGGGQRVERRGRTGRHQGEEAEPGGGRQAGRADGRGARRQAAGRVIERRRIGARRQPERRFQGGVEAVAARGFEVPVELLVNPPLPFVK